MDPNNDIGGPMTSAKRDAIARGIAQGAKKRRGILRDKIIQLVTTARPEFKDELLNRIADENAEVRPFSRRKRWNFAASGSPSAVLTTFADEAQWCKPFKFGNSDQDTGDGSLYISEIVIEAPGNLKRNTIAEMRRQYGLVIHYAGGKKPRWVPLADVLVVGSDGFAIDAGNNSGTAVAGTNHQAGPARGMQLDEDEVMIVAPKDQAVGLELKLLPEYSSGPTLTGETAALYFDVTFRGLRHGTDHANR
jgi:hypothetical protein